MTVCDNSGESVSLNTAAPSLSTMQIQSLLWDKYGKICISKELTSERDQNLYIQTEDGQSFLLKITNPSEQEGVTYFQTSALAHIEQKAPDYPVPRLVPTLEGAYHTKIILPQGGESTVRLLTFLDGVQACHTLHDSAQRQALGRSLAKLDQALSDFSHPSAHHDLLWNISKAHNLAHMVDDISGSERRRLVEHFMLRFKTVILPLLADLRTQVIHNDFNLYNVLTDPNNSAHVTGVIDFGDILHAPLVGEIATGAAYQMAGQRDPFAAASEFIGAYHQVSPLEAAEQEIVTDLIAIRHMITILISEWRSIRYPENRVYIMRHNSDAWDLLKKFASISPNDARSRVLKYI